MWSTLAGTLYIGFLFRGQATVSTYKPSRNDSSRFVFVALAGDGASPLTHFFWSATGIGYGASNQKRRYQYLSLYLAYEYFFICCYMCNGWVDLFVLVKFKRLQRHVNDPGHSAKRAGGRLHLNKHTPLTQRHRVGSYKETSSHATSQWNTWPQSSRLAEPLWTDPGLRSEISVRDLIST